MFILEMKEWGCDLFSQGHSIRPLCERRLPLHLRGFKYLSVVDFFLETGTSARF